MLSGVSTLIVSVVFLIFSINIIRSLSPAGLNAHSKEQLEDLKRRKRREIAFLCIILICSAITSVRLLHWIFLFFFIRLAPSSLSLSLSLFFFRLCFPSFLVVMHGGFSIWSVNRFIYFFFFLLMCFPFFSRWWFRSLHSISGHFLLLKRVMVLFDVIQVYQYVFFLVLRNVDFEYVLFFLSLISSPPSYHFYWYRFLHIECILVQSFGVNVFLSTLIRFLIRICPAMAVIIVFVIIPLANVKRVSLDKGIGMRSQFGSGYSGSGRSQKDSNSEVLETSTPSSRRPGMTSVVSNPIHPHVRNIASKDLDIQQPLLINEDAFSSSSSFSADRRPRHPKPVAQSILGNPISFPR